MSNNTSGCTVAQCVTARSIFARDTSNILSMKAIFEIFGPNVKRTAQCQDNRDLSRKVTDERFSSIYLANYQTCLLFARFITFLAFSSPGPPLLFSRRGLGSRTRGLLRHTLVSWGKITSKILLTDLHVLVPQPTGPSHKEK